MRTYVMSKREDVTLSIYANICLVAAFKEGFDKNEMYI